MKQTLKVARLMAGVTLALGVCAGGQGKQEAVPSEAAAGPKMMNGQTQQPAPKYGVGKPLAAKTPTQTPNTAQTSTPIQQQISSGFQQILNQLKGAQDLEPVPDLSGLSQADATTRLRAVDLQGSFSNTGHPNWRVAAQNPTSGKLKARETVAVTMGPLVPPLGGIPLADATARVQAAGLQLGTVTHEGTVSAVPLVARQSPKEGTAVLPGSGVSIWLPPQYTPPTHPTTDTTTPTADGTNTTPGTDGNPVSAGDGRKQPPAPDQPKMPNVRTLTYKQASSVLEGLGVVPVPDQGREFGTVQDQSVAAGKPVTRDERVTLTMGVVVPNLVGLSVADAERQLGAVNLRVEYGDGQPATTSIITQQVPAAKSVATTDLTVTLYTPSPPGAAWWIAAVVVLGLLVWGVVKILKAIRKTLEEKSNPQYQALPTEFRVDIKRKAQPVSIKKAPKVSFEVRAKHGGSEVRTMREAHVKSVSQGEKR
jgi:beta-lactam-binding protein with PASTA domain